MLRIENQSARSREAELGLDRGLKSQQGDPLQRGNARAGLSLDRAGVAGA